MSERFECCFENSNKGVYLDVHANEQYNYVSFASYNNFEPEVEVCVRKEDAKKIIDILQSFVGNKNINSDFNLNIAQIQLLRGLLYSEITNLEEQVLSCNIVVADEWMNHLRSTMITLDRLEDEFMK